MKQKKKKMNIKVTITFLCILLLMFGIYFIMRKINSEEYKLKKIGYSTKEISVINTDNHFIEYALNNEYNDKLVDFIKANDFKFELLESYLNYYKEHNDVPINDIVYLINNDISYEYSPLLMEFTKDKYFLKTRIERYLNYQKTHSDLNIREIVKRVNSDIDYDFYTNDVDSDTSLGFLIIANKHYKLNSNYTPSDLITIEGKYAKYSQGQVNSTVYNYYQVMYDEMKKEGLTLLIQSPYRSYNTQYSIYNGYVARDGKASADTYSARPGYSEHQTGLAIDFATPSTTGLSNEEFGNTPEFRWLKDNAHKYGFILRYKQGEEYITGYMYESWHFRYVGVDAATTIYNEGLNYEEYFTYYVLKK